MKKLVLFLILFHTACSAQANVFDLVPHEIRAQIDCELARTQLLQRIAGVRWHMPNVTQDEYLSGKFPEWMPQWEQDIWQQLISDAYAWPRDEQSWVDYWVKKCLEMGRSI